MFVGIKLDEDLSPLAAQPLISAGINVTTVLQQGWGGNRDRDIWPMIQRERRLFITADKGFGDIREYPPGTHHGIVLLRPDYESILAYRSLLANLLDGHDLSKLHACLTVVSHRSIRIRRP